MSTVVSDVQFRRPALRRQSVLVPLYKTLDDYLHRLCRYQINEYIVLLETLGAQIAPYTTNMFAFDIQEEIGKVRTVANTVFEVLYDYTWDHIVSGKASDDILRNQRIQSLLLNTVMGLPIQSWLEWTLQQVYSHIIQESKNIIPYALLKYSVEGTLKSLLRQCPTFLLQAETLSDFMQELLKKLPGNTMLYNELHKIVYGIKTIDPDVVYTQVRQLIILPPTLIACIREELVCQEAFDTLEYKLRKTKQDSRKSESRKSRRSQRRGSSRTQSNPRHALRAARQAMYEAEQRTAKLVKWYDVGEEVAKKRLAYQKTLVGKQSVLHNTKRRIRNFLHIPVNTDAQQNARHQLKKALDVQARYDPSLSLQHTQKRNAQPVSLLNCSLLEIIFAILSPFHIYHKKWTGKPEFVALTHHLHMLNLLPALGKYIPKHSTDFRYVQHVRGVPFTDMDTKKNQQECMRDTEQNHELWCNIALGMDKKNPTLPRDVLLKEKHCYDPTMIARAKKKAAKFYRRIEREEATVLDKPVSRASRKKHTM